MSEPIPKPVPVRRRKPCNPKVVVRDLTYYEDGHKRKSDHTSLRMDDQTRAKLRELAARVYGGTSQSTVIRLLIQAAWAKLKTGEAESGVRSGKPSPSPSLSPETALRDPSPETLAAESGMSADQLRGLLKLKTELDAETGIPVAMVKAWYPFEHQPWVPGLKRIWAWVQSREARLRRALVASRPQSQSQSQSQSQFQSVEGESDGQ